MDVTSRVDRATAGLRNGDGPRQAGPEPAGAPRARARRVTGHDVDASKIGITNLEMQTSVEMNDPVPWSFTLNNRTNVNFFMPEWCPAPFPEGSGTLFDITVRYGGSVVHSETQCVPDEGGSAFFSGRFFSASRPGTDQVTFTIRTVPVGQVVAETTVPLDVFSGSPDPGDCPTGFVRDPDTGECVRESGNNGNNGNGGGPILPCWLDPNRSCATPELMAWLLVIGAGVGLFVLD